MEETSAGVADDGLRAKALSGLLWTVFERWLNRGIGMALLVLLTRLIAPADFGLMVFASTVVILMQVFVDSGFSRALIQRRVLGPYDASTAFWTSLVTGVVLAVAIAASAPLISRMLNQPEATPILQVLALSLPIDALSRTPAALLERDLRFRTLSIRGVISTFCGCVAAAPLAIIGLGVWALVAQAMATNIAAVVVLWSTTDWRPKMHFSWEALREMRGVGTSILAIDLLDTVQANADKLVVGIFFSPSQLGFYYLAQRICNVLTDLVTSVISRVSLTTFSRMQDDLPRLNRTFRKMTFAACALSIPVFTLTALLAPQIIPFAFGSRWSAAIPLLWLLAPASVIGTLMYFDRTALLATGQARTALGVAIFQNIAGIALLFAFVPIGVTGVALSRSARIFTWPIRLVILHRTIALEVWPYVMQTIRCLLAIAVPGVAILYLQTTSWADQGAAIFAFAVPVGVLGLLLYAALLWFVAGDENLRVAKAILSDTRSSAPGRGKRGSKVVDEQAPVKTEVEMSVRASAPVEKG